MSIRIPTTEREWFEYAEEMANKNAHKSYEQWKAERKAKEPDTPPADRAGG